MILINYNVVTKKVVIKSEELKWNREFSNIESVNINQSHQHATFSFIKSQEETKSQLLVLPDNKKEEFKFSTNLPYLYTEDKYESNNDVNN